MQEAKDLTDAELVEAVAREVVGMIHEENIANWHPLTDMNDLFMVLEKFRYYRITKHIGCNTIGKYDCTVASTKEFTSEDCTTLQRAVLEAVLMAERGKG